MSDDWEEGYAEGQSEGYETGYEDGREMGIESVKADVLVYCTKTCTNEPKGPGECTCPLCELAEWLEESH